MTRRDWIGAAALAAFPYERQIRSAEREVFRLVNDERERAGLPLLEWSEALADVARAHSVRMMVREFFGHIDPEFGNTADRLNAANVHWSRCAENIFCCANLEDPSRLAVIAWMTSPGHRANILLDAATESGMGIHIVPGDKWWITQVFIHPR